MKQSIVVKVVTAMDIGDSEKKRVESFVSHKHRDEDVQFAYELDSSIIGGLLIQDGEKCYDGTVKTQLIKMRKKLS